MSVFTKIFRSNFLIKLRSWEYWPFGIVQFPAILYYLWLSLKSRSFIFFSAANPGIEMGGMFGESKFSILSKIPEAYKPKTILLRRSLSTDEVLRLLHEQALTLPVVFKPDLGERGHMVRRIFTRDDIEAYLRNVKVDFVAQELVDLPLEFGVLYERKPNEQKGFVTSVTGKRLLSVTGDGQKSLRELILSLDRAKLQWDKLAVKFASRLDEVIPKDVDIELVSIGNHCLGTMFLDRTDLINNRLHETFNHISQQIPGFYFGRFDLRCASINDLYNGKIKILELNGCGAEPAHIYEPGYSFFKAMRVLVRHWKQIHTIARQNNLKGVKYTSLAEAKRYYRDFKRATS